MGAAVVVSVPGTCGELVQGWHPEWDEPVLVSCPIRLFARAEVRLRPGRIIISPVGRPKARQAARLLLDHLGLAGVGAEVRLRGELLPSRGMASSTADVIGVMVGLTHALGRLPQPERLARLACRIEPSDSIMFDGLAALAYHSGERHESLGRAPALPLLMLDTGQTVDTLEYNARLDWPAVRRLAPSTREAMEILREGLALNDAEAVGAAATLSAMNYQVVNDNPLLPQAQAWAKATGAVGVARAHSGSVIGLLYREGDDLDGPARWIADRFEGEITKTRLIDGGWKVNPPIQE